MERNAVLKQQSTRRYKTAKTKTMEQIVPLFLFFYTKPPSPLTKERKKGIFHCPFNHTTDRKGKDVDKRRLDAMRHTARDLPLFHRFIFRLICRFTGGWYFFLPINHRQFKWSDPVETQGGATTPIVRTETAWQRYAIIEMLGTEYAYLVTEPHARWWRVLSRLLYLGYGTRLGWVCLSRQVLPGDRIRFGVGKGSCSVYFVSPLDQNKSRIVSFTEFGLDNDDPGADRRYSHHL